MTLVKRARRAIRGITNGLKQITSAFLHVTRLLIIHNWFLLTLNGFLANNKMEGCCPRFFKTNWMMLCNIHVDIRWARCPIRLLCKLSSSFPFEVSYKSLGLSALEIWEINENLPLITVPNTLQINLKKDQSTAFSDSKNIQNLCNYPLIHSCLHAAT